MQTGSLPIIREKVVSMNSETGQVLPEAELMEKFRKLSDEARRVEQPKWRMFEIGETIQIKGIAFTVHEVGDQRLILKFKP